MLKWILYNNQWHFVHLLGLDEAPKHFSIWKMYRKEVINYLVLCKWNHHQQFLKLWQNLKSRRLLQGKPVKCVKNCIVGTSRGVMVSKLDEQTVTRELESHQLSHSYNLVPYLSKKLWKLLKNCSIGALRCVIVCEFNWQIIVPWQQHPTRHQLYGHLPPITKTIQVRRTRHAGHCWRSRDELIRDVLLWIPTHGRAKAGRPARTYIQQLCEDTGCCPEDLPRAMNDREEWRERVRDIRAASTIWWWWWLYSSDLVP